MSTDNTATRTPDRIRTCVDFCQGVSSDLLHPGRLALLIDKANNQDRELAILRERVRVLENVMQDAERIITGPIADLLTGDSMNDTGTYSLINNIQSLLNKTTP